jgi:polysaccharide biosynthesis transport protein
MYLGAEGGGLVEHGSDAALSHYLRILKRGLWLVVLTTALATLGALYASHREHKLYRSSADVLLSNQNLAANLSNIQSSNEDPTRVAATQADLAQTPPVAERALRLAHLTNRTPQQLLSHSSVSSASNADILTFAVTDPSPAVAQRLAQSYAIAYTRYRKQLDTASIAQALKKVEARLGELKAAGAQGSAGYANLVDTEQQLSSMDVLQGANAQLIRSAGPAAKTQPKTTRNAALGAVLGLLLGVGLAFFRDTLNTRVRTEGEVQDLLNLPLLARIPEPARRLRSKNRLVMLSEPGKPDAETYRILGTNLDIVNLERSARTIMFTSAERAEGKSTTVSNLAVALARAGRRIILVDLDLRKPSIGGFFNVDDKGGLTNVALGTLDLEDALVPIPFVEKPPDSSSQNGTAPGVLQVLPVGPLPPNPAEFIGSHTLAALLAKLETRADLVLIDAAPMLQLSDAMALTSRIDALVVVARLSSARRSVLNELRRVLDSAPIAKLGVVVTGAQHGEPYSGGYGYGDAEGAQRGATTRREYVG